MKYNLFYLLSIILFSSTLSFAESEKMQAAKEAMISGQIEFAKAEIDHKCQKIKLKIREAEGRLASLEEDLNCQENGLSQVADFLERRVELLTKIKKYEDKIDSLRTIKNSLDIINFNSL